MGKVQRLRNAGKRLSDIDIARSQYVQGEVVVSGLGDTTVATVTDPNSTVGDSLLPQLFEARPTTMHGSKMLFKGEERPQATLGRRTSKNGRY